MDIQIVEDHHIAASQAWRELGADISIEGGTIDGPIDNPRRDKPIAAQARDEGLRVPPAKGRIGHESRSA